MQCIYTLHSYSAPMQVCSWVSQSACINCPRKVHAWSISTDRLQVRQYYSRE